MKIPYGIADFYSLRTEDHLYVDRSDRIAVTEDLGKSLLFLRPRRFGKSLWLSTLANYYDLRTAGEHQRLFGDLAVGETPTPLARRYFVMRWDFSKIDPDPPPWGVNANVGSRIERLGNELRGYLNTTIRVFQRDYRGHLPEILELAEDPFHNFEELLSVIRETPYRLYLLIDEYDNFANEILTDDEEVYHQLVKSDGPFKYLFKWVKGLMAGAGLDSNLAADEGKLELLARVAARHEPAAGQASGEETVIRKDQPLVAPTRNRSWSTAIPISVCCDGPTRGRRASATCSSSSSGCRSRSWG